MIRDVIELRDLRVVAIVGVLPDERVVPQAISIDLDLVRSFDAAAESDDLAHTTNYAEVLTLAHTVTVEGRFELLETLARRLGDAVLAYDDAISEVTVAVRKVVAPVSQTVASVGVRCTRGR